MPFWTLTFARTTRCVGVGVFFLFACRNPAEPIGSARVAVLGSSVGVADGVVTGAISFRVTNHGPMSLTFHPCGSGIERRTDVGAWEPVWSQGCVGPDIVIELAPGKSHEWVFEVWHRRTLGDPRWPNTPLDGTYRVYSMLVDPRREMLPPASRLSEAFALLEPAS